MQADAAMQAVLGALVGLWAAGRPEGAGLGFGPVKFQAGVKGPGVGQKGRAVGAGPRGPQGPALGLTGMGSRSDLVGIAISSATQTCVKITPLCLKAAVAARLSPNLKAKRFVRPGTRYGILHGSILPD